MELSEFICKTLIDIQSGVQKAQREVKDQKLSGAISPVWRKIENVSKDDMRNVAFDIAVVASESSTKEASGEVKVLGIGIDGAGSASTEKQNVTRIQFEVPIIFPVHVLQYKDE